MDRKKLENAPDIVRLVDYKMPPVPPIIDYPTGQESRRKRREMERKKKRK